MAVRLLVDKSNMVVDTVKNQKSRKLIPGHIWFALRSIAVSADGTPAHADGAPPCFGNCGKDCAAVAENQISMKGVQSILVEYRTELFSIANW